METFRADTLPEDLKPVMSYVSYTEPGMGQGPHENKQQTDIFAFLGSGNLKICLWDNRSQSATYGVRTVVFGGKDNPITVIIPPGVVHAYKNISKTERGMVLNYPDKLYAGWNKKRSGFIQGKPEKIDWIVNCSGYTAVDKAEDEPAQAYRINADGILNIAGMARTLDAALIHISTDYVFSGEEDRPDPGGVYANSKLMGEEYILEALKMR